MKQETLQLTGGSGKKKRRALDFYPTPKNVTHALIDFLKENDRISEDDYVWEPACGEGHMSEVLKDCGLKVFSSDIKQTEYCDKVIDFVNDNLENEMEHHAIITNPPFDESEQFIKIALTKSRIVCMLLKSQYWHAKGRYNLFKENAPAYILPLTWRPDFLEHERKAGEKKGAPTMEVFWCVWIRGINETKYLPLLKPF